MPQSTSIRLLALDIDGTLVTKGDTVAEPTRSALQRAHEAGVVVSIATGRRYRTAMRVVETLALSSPLVCLGGALVKDGRGNTLHAQPLPCDDFALVTECLRELGHTAVGQCAADGNGVFDLVIDEAGEWNETTQAYYERNSLHAHRFSSTSQAAALRDDVLVVGAFGTDRELAQVERAIEARWPGRFFITLMSGGGPGGSYLEVIPADVSKWRGLVRLAASLGIATDAICAVGDERNDLPMIRGAALGVAMGNAIDEVKRAADWVTGRHDENGLVAVVDRILER